MENGKDEKSGGRTSLVTVLGTGIMGAAMARNLHKHGFTVRVWNRTAAKAEPLASEGIAVAPTPPEAVAGARVVLTVLNDGPSVLETMNAAAPSLDEGTVWLQATTVGIAAVRDLADFAERHKLVFVDAPVQGTKQPAERGELVVMAAGPQCARPVAQSVFDAIGQRTLWVADSGSQGTASRLKLTLNAYAFTVTHGLGEALALAKGLDVDPALFFEVVTGGPMDNPFLQAKGAAMRKDDYATSFTVTNAIKDSELIVRAAQAANVRIDLAEAGLRRFQRAERIGHGDSDMAATHLAGF